MYALNRPDLLPISHPYLSPKTTTPSFSAMGITILALAAIVCAGILYALKNANQPKKLELPSKRPLPWEWPYAHPLKPANEAILRKLFEKSCYSLESLPELRETVLAPSKITFPIMLSTIHRGVFFGGYPCLLLRISGQSPTDHRIRGMVQIWQDSVLQEHAYLEDIDDDSRKQWEPLFFKVTSQSRSRGEVVEKDGGFTALQTLISEGEVLWDGHKWKLDHSKWKV